MNKVYKVGDLVRRHSDNAICIVEEIRWIDGKQQIKLVKWL